MLNKFWTSADILFIPEQVVPTRPEHFGHRHRAAPTEVSMEIELTSMPDRNWWNATIHNDGKQLLQLGR